MDTYSTKLGLFGYDMAQFFSDCAIAGQYCSVDRYSDYDGWMVGATVDVALNQPDLGFCFVRSGLCTYVKHEASGATTVY